MKYISETKRFDNGYGQCLISKIEHLNLILLSLSLLFFVIIIFIIIIIIIIIIVLRSLSPLVFLSS